MNYDEKAREIILAMQGSWRPEPILAAALQAAAEEAREACAKVVEAAAKGIKHTSHRDGLGMGDLLTEGRLAGCAATIRERGEGC